MLIPEKILEKCHSYGMRDYPEETCGFIVGKKDVPESLEEIYPMKNIMNDMHHENPKKFPLTGKNGFMIAPLEQIKLERILSKKNQKIKIIYHSHPDVGAYFSTKDKEDALWNGKERFPGISFLVCATNQGKPGEAILAEFNTTKGDFEIKHIPNLSKKRSSKLLGGKFGITGILPTLDYIHKWKKGEHELENGYFRFAPPKQVKKLQKKLCDLHQVKHALAYCSANTALLELLSYFQDSCKKTKIYLSEIESSLNKAIKSLGFILLPLSLKNLVQVKDFSPKKTNFIFISIENPKKFLKNNKKWLKQLENHQIPAIIFCENSSFLHNSLLDMSWSNGLTFFVVGFSNLESNDSEEIIGGAIICNNDRQMFELGEYRKQHGSILSARNASKLLKDTNIKKQKSQKTTDQLGMPIINIPYSKEIAVKNLLCEWENASDALLFPSGMAAIMSTIKSLRTKRKSKVIVIGLLYSDTYSLLMGSGHSSAFETVFLGLDDLKKLPKFLSEDTAMVITETITNPLCEVPDLEYIGKLTNDLKIPLVVDNTLATPANCQPIDWGADYVIHSTTKFLNGTNDHAGGAVLIKSTKNINSITELHKNWKLNISQLEVNILWDRMQNFKERIKKFNSNCISIAHFLEENPSVSNVFYPYNQSKLSYTKTKKLLRGNGGVVSFVLKNDTSENLRRFYDGDFSNILKAPTLGSNQTLICPYTLLTHYHYNDEELREIQLPRNLIRIAVGCETKIDRILVDLNYALSRTMK